jgi:hypothetical protein
MGWSVFLQNMQTVQYQGEGFNYLGLGALILLLLALYNMLLENRGKDAVRRWWPVLLVSGVITAVAVSNVVTFCQHTLFTIPLPHFIETNILGMWRGSGRLFWPVTYFILAFALTALPKQKRLAIGILVAIVAIQWYDIHGELQRMDKRYANRQWQTPLVSSYWSEATKVYKHISFLPTFAHGHYENIAMYAVANNLTLNTGYVARDVLARTDNLLASELDRVKRGELDPDTMYIFPFSYKEFVEHIDPAKDVLATIDSYMVLSPGWKTVKTK